MQSHSAEVLASGTKEAKDALEAAVRSLLLTVGTHGVADDARVHLDATLATTLAAHTTSFKAASLRPLNICAAYRGFFALPRLTEQARCTLATAPAKGAVALEKGALHVLTG